MAHSINEWLEKFNGKEITVTISVLPDEHMNDEAMLMGMEEDYRETVND